MHSRALLKPGRSRSIDEGDSPEAGHNTWTASDVKQHVVGVKRRGLSDKGKYLVMAVLVTNQKRFGLAGELIEDFGLMPSSVLKAIPAGPYLMQVAMTLSPSLWSGNRRRRHRPEDAWPKTSVRQLRVALSLAIKRPPVRAALLSARILIAVMPVRVSPLADSSGHRVSPASGPAAHCRCFRR